MLKEFQNKRFKTRYSVYAVLYDDELKQFCVGEWSPSCKSYIRISNYYRNPVPVENIIKKMVSRYE